MMKNMNGVLKFVLLLAMMILTVSVAYAAITFVSPSVAGTTLTGVYNLNVTTGINATNCTFSTTQNTNFTVVTNGSGILSWSTSYATSGLTNAEDTSLSAVCKNTTTVESGSLTVNVDNTAPTCSFTHDQPSENLQYGTPLRITDGSSDTTDLSYAYKVYDPANGVSASSTSASPTFDYTSFSVIGGVYTIGLVLTDEAALVTSCTNQTLLILAESNSGDNVVIVKKTTTDAEKRSNLPMILGGVVVVIVLLSAVGYFVIQGVKGKKRRR